MGDTLLFWFVAIRFSEVPEYILELEKYIDPSATLLIAKEVVKGAHKKTNGEHIHVAVDMSVETYNRFHDNIHKKKLKLVLKAKDGIGKQVGREKKVEDQRRLLIYCCKDKDLYSKNIDQAELQSLIDESFPKTESWEDQISTYLKENYDEGEGWDFASQGFNIENLEDLVIYFYIEFSKSKAVPTRTFIRKCVCRFLMYDNPYKKVMFHQIKNYIL